MALGSTKKGSISLGRGKTMYIFPQNIGKKHEKQKDKTQIPMPV